MDALAGACATMAKKKKHCGAPRLFRVVLVGPRGSGCRSVANYLSQRFKLVHGKPDTNNFDEAAKIERKSLRKDKKILFEKK